MALLITTRVREEKLVCIFTVVIQEKCEASNFKNKNYKFLNLFLIFVRVYYDVKLKGIAYVEIFLTNHKAIKLQSDLVRSIKKNGQSNPAEIYC